MMKAQMKKQTSQPKTSLLGWTDKFGYIALAVVILASIAMFFKVDLNLLENKPPTDRDTWVDKSGHLHVLGLTLGLTTLREAEIRLKSRSDIALYVNPEIDAPGLPTLSLEAYFPSITDHSKIVLGLDASKKLLVTLQQNATLPRVYPNGVIRMNLSGTQQIDLQNLKVAWIKFSPSVNVTQDMLTARFGIADDTSTSGDTSFYYYSHIGLVAQLNKVGKDILIFRSPNNEKQQLNPKKLLSKAITRQ